MAQPRGVMHLGCRLRKNKNPKYLRISGPERGEGTLWRISNLRHLKGIVSISRPVSEHLGLGPQGLVYNLETRHDGSITTTPSWCLSFKPRLTVHFSIIFQLHEVVGKRRRYTNAHNTGL